MSAMKPQSKQRGQWLQFVTCLVAVSLWLNGCVIRPASISNEGGIIKGNAYVGQETARQTRVQLAAFPLYLREVQTDRVVAQVTTDPAGNYTFAGLPPGNYQICWQQAGWVADCSQETITVGQRTASYPAALFVAPAIGTDPADNIETGIVLGNVRLRNGALPLFRSNLFGINITSTVELLDQDGAPIQAPVAPNNNGAFIFTDIPINADRVRARFGADVIERPLFDKARILNGVAPVDLAFTNHFPEILALKADLTHQTRTNDLPTITVQAEARDQDGDPLTYSWAVVESTAAVTWQGAQASWRLPSTPGLYTLYLLVQDGKGGYAASDLTLSNTNERIVDPDSVVAAALASEASPSTSPTCQAPPTPHSPPHDTQFLTWDYYIGNATAQDAQDYYQAVDPQNQRTTLRQWWATNGFDAATGHPITSTGVISANLAYLNNSALGVGRDMHCVQQLSGNVACYVTNYGLPNQKPINADYAATRNPQQVGATVAMEYAPVEGSSDLTPVVKFFAFDKLNIADGIRIKGLKLGGNDFAYLPTLCLYCHGGRYSATSANQINLGASFREFDSTTFCFPQAGLQPTSAQAQSIYQLNQIISATHPAQAIQQVIQNWYPVAPNAAASANSVTPADYVPPDWRVSVQSEQIQPPQLYRNVVNKSCRTCHIAYAEVERFNWSSYTEFKVEQDSICEKVYALPAMPHAKIPYDNFWRNGQNQSALLATFLNYDATGGAQGCPP